MPSPALQADRRGDRPGNSAGDTLRLSARATGRRPLLAVGSLALVTACVAVFVGLYARAGTRLPVLVVDRAVAQGTQISASDLGVVDVSASPGLSAIPAHDAREVVGRTASFPLVPGTLLVRADLGGSGGVPAGDVIVGVAAQPGQLPAGGVQPGDHVDVDVTAPSGSLAVTTPTAAADGSGSTPTVTLSGGVIAQGVRVVAVAAGNATGAGASSAVVSVAVPASIGPLVANAAVAGQVALTLVAGAP